MSLQKSFGFALLAITGLAFAAAPATARAKALPVLPANNSVNGNSTFAAATISGIVRDENGNPIANAIIVLMRDGASFVKQVRSHANGNFVARVAPGRYTLNAVANGFSAVSLTDVEVARAEQVAFRFNLVRTGNGDTLPERRADRNSAKWRLRSNAARRTIYQNNEGTSETVNAEAVAAETEPQTESSSENFAGRAAGYVETFVASSANRQVGEYAGVNFAVAQPVSEDLEIAFAGQAGFGRNAAQSLQTAARYKIGDNHKLNLNLGAGKIGQFRFDDGTTDELGQLSVQALDEWRVKDNLILVVGFDYSRFIGASNRASVAPRFGVQFDANAKTRLRAAYTVQNQPQSNWQQAIDLEDNPILFRQPEPENYAVVDNPNNKEVLMPRLRRFEIGVERVLDNQSNVEALAFFDATTNRGVSFFSFPLANFADAQSEDAAETPLNAVQNGSSNGARVVYTRRFNQTFSGSIGYAFGNGQQLSADGAINPENIFDSKFFQTIAVQFAADFDCGTNIKTVWRYAPRSAVFAIDPFAGRINVYDPNLSVLVSQKLPTWGLPIRAKAMLDARNLFDLQTENADGETTLRLNSARRTLRGGIAVRF